MYGQSGPERYNSVYIVLVYRKNVLLETGVTRDIISTSLVLIVLTLFAALCRLFHYKAKTGLSQCHTFPLAANHYSLIFQNNNV